jgi:tRNA 2-selenouridine synthase
MDPEVPRSTPSGPIPCRDALERLAGFDTIIDVRSPSEFAEDHVPGAINCPVLDDAQRAEIGTLYKQVSSFAARRRGAVLVARSIADHVERQFSRHERDWLPLVYCWRGGERSGALAHVLARIGWRVRQLEGGYRAYRRWVVDTLERLPVTLDLRVICGTTGSGKSRLLRHLQNAGAQVLDLEALAHHRGSVLGGLPGLPQPSQKMFDSRIWTALRELDPRRPVYVESESRKVGQLRVPAALIERMRAARCLRIELPFAERVRLLRDEYAHFESAPAELLAQVDCLTALHGRERVGEWKRLIERAEWEPFVARLLAEHYDPSYLRSIQRNFTRYADAEVIRIERSDDASFEARAREMAARLVA